MTNFDLGVDLVKQTYAHIQFNKKKYTILSKKRSKNEGDGPHRAATGWGGRRPQHGDEAPQFGDRGRGRVVGHRVAVPPGHDAVDDQHLADQPPKHGAERFEGGGIVPGTGVDADDKVLRFGGAVRVGRDGGVVPSSGEEAEAQEQGGGRGRRRGGRRKAAAAYGQGRGRAMEKTYTDRPSKDQ
jgi:hypothetical protein